MIVSHWLGQVGWVKKVEKILAAAAAIEYG
jgi:hypothetical protein